MKTTYMTLITIICLSSLVSCINPSGAGPLANLNPEETFERSDAPVEYSFDSFTFQGPWGYDKNDNASRYYPLFVSGRWGEGQSQYNNVAQDYPAFVLDYQKGSESDGIALGVWIKKAVDAGYRIDTNRIYLTGFSWGGSGSYPLAKGLYKENLYFAAILRVAGQSQSDLGNDIAEKTAVWYHIGLNDTSARVNVARTAMENMRNYSCNRRAVETTVADSVSGYSRTTVTLTRNGYPVFKYSEYAGMGHTSGPCYTDDALFPWLFNNSLVYR